MRMAARVKTPPLVMANLATLVLLAILMAIPIYHMGIAMMAVTGTTVAVARVVVPLLFSTITSVFAAVAVYMYVSDTAHLMFK